MAANTTGSKSLDSIRTNQLCVDVINFSKNIVLKSVGFTYPKSRKGILKNCNLKINKGS